jgi:hypothetical protein
VESFLPLVTTSGPAPKPLPLRLTNNAELF